MLHPASWRLLCIWRYDLVGISSRFKIDINHCNQITNKMYSFIDRLFDCANVVVGVLAHVFGVKFLAFLPVQLYYEQQKSWYEASKLKNFTNIEVNDREKLRKSIVETYNFMIKYGVAYRDAGGYHGIALGMFMMFFPMLYYGCRWFYRKELEEGSNFLAFIRDYKQEMRGLNRRVNKYISKTRVSIENHMKILAANEKINSSSYINDSIDLSSDPLLISQIEFIVEQISANSSSFNKDNNNNLNYYKHKNGGNNSVSSPEEIKRLVRAFRINRHETHKLMDLLDASIKYLDELRFTSKKLLIWPVSRNSTWHKQILKRYTIVTINSMINYYLFGMICLLQITWMAIERIRANELIEPNLRKFNALDTIEVIFFFSFVYITLNSYTEPTVFLYTSFLDLGKYLSSITKEFHRLDDKLALLNSSQDKGKLYLDCNLQLLELYVSFQIFAGEIRSMFKRAEHSVVFLYCVLALNILVLIILTLTNSTLSSLWLLTGVLQFAMNLCIVPCAILNQKCQDISKIAYHMIVQAEEFNMNNKEYKISSHSLNLWRRLIADSQLYSENFSCKLLGIASLNYGTVVRLNFYIISSIFLLVSHTSH